VDRWIGDHDRSLDQSVDPCRSDPDRDRPAITILYFLIFTNNIALTVQHNQISIGFPPEIHGSIKINFMSINKQARKIVAYLNSFTLNYYVVIYNQAK
jgi:hypothetical protein